MALDLAKLTQEVAGIETVVASVAQVVHTIADEVKALRGEAGGAVQSQVDALAEKLHAQATALGLAVQEGTAAEDETPAPATSEAVLADQAADSGAAQLAADHLDEQAVSAP